MLIIKLFIVLLSFALFTASFRSAAGSLKIRKLNIISFIYYNILIFSFVGASMIFLGFNQHYMVEKIESDEIINKTYALLIYSIIALPLFIKLFMSLFTGNRYTSKYEIFLEEKSIISSDNNAYNIALFATLIGIVATVYVFLKLGNVPLISFIKNPSLSGILRSSSTKEYTGSAFVRSTIMMTFTPLISYFCWIYFRTLEGPARQRWKALLIINIILSVVIKTYNLEKSPVVYYFFYFLILDLMMGGKTRDIFNSKKFNRNFHRAIIALAILIAGMYIYSGYTGSLFSFSNGPISRIFITQPSTLFLHIQVFPKYHSFLKGASLPTAVSWIVGSKESWLRSGKIVMQIYNRAGVLSGEAGVMNAFFPGEAYANWGILGVIVSPIIVALPISLTFSMLLRRAKTPYVMIVYIALFITFTNPIQGGFVDFIYSFNAIMIILLALGLNAFINNGLIRISYAKR